MLGKVITTVDPGEGNPRNSEGAFYTFENGKLIFVYSRYRGDSFHDNASCDLYKKESFDGGETFSAPVKVFSCEDCGGSNIMSVSLIKLKNGRAGMFFVRKKGDRSSTIMLSESSDGNKWTKPRRILNDEGYFVFNNDRAVRLKDGRLVFAVSRHTVEEISTKNGKETVFAPGVVYIYGSDDDRNFYRLSQGYSLNNCPSGLQEPLVIELGNGAVYCYARTENGCQYRMKAKDKSLTRWSNPVKTVFTGPCAPLSMKYLKKDLLFAVWCAYPPEEDREEYMRNWEITFFRPRLVCAFSRDDGKTFSEPEVIEYDLTRGFCYCAIEPSGDSVLLAYCSGGIKEKCCLNRITVRKIKIAEIVG